MSNNNHILRVNVYGKGFTLYAGNPSIGFKIQNLNIKSDVISNGYLKLQKRIDNILDSKLTLWTLSFRQDSPDEKPIIGYGIFVENAKDDKGRSTGLYFIHAIEIDSSKYLFSSVEKVITFLSSKETSISSQIADVAIGKKDINEFLEEITKGCETIPDKFHEIGKNILPSKLKGIEHDYLGSNVFAWLMMAYNLNNSTKSWEVCDVYDRNKNITTININDISGEIVCASEFIYRLVNKDFSNDNVNSTKTIEVEQPNNLLNHLKENNEMVSITKKCLNEPNNNDTIDFSKKKKINWIGIFLFLINIILISYFFYQERMIDYYRQKLSFIEKQLKEVEEDIDMIDVRYKINLDELGTKRTMELERELAKRKKENDELEKERAKLKNLLKFLIDNERNSNRIKGKDTLIDRLNHELISTYEKNFRLMKTIDSLKNQNNKKIRKF